MGQKPDRNGSEGMLLVGGCYHNSWGRMAFLSFQMVKTRTWARIAEQDLGFRFARRRTALEYLCDVAHGRQ
jgi:hypothetical protein